MGSWVRGFVDPWIVAQGICAVATVFRRQEPQAGLGSLSEIRNLTRSSRLRRLVPSSWSFCRLLVRSSAGLSHGAVVTYQCDLQWAAGRARRESTPATVRWMTNAGPGWRADVPDDQQATKRPDNKERSAKHGVRVPCTVSGVYGVRCAEYPDYGVYSSDWRCPNNNEASSKQTSTY